MWKNFHLSTLGNIIFLDFVISDIAKLATIIAFWHKKRRKRCTPVSSTCLMLNISLPVLFLFYLLVLESEFDMRYHFSKFLFSLLSNSFRCFVITGIRYRHL